MSDKPENLGVLFILLTITAIIISIFIISYVGLNNFKKCYDNEFRDVWCEKYRNY